jgi:hypothetical protein
VLGGLTDLTDLMGSATDQSTVSGAAAARAAAMEITREVNRASSAGAATLRVAHADVVAGGRFSRSGGGRDLQYVRTGAGPVSLRFDDGAAVRTVQVAPHSIAVFSIGAGYSIDTTDSAVLVGDVVTDGEAGA